jgi:ribokinase
VIDTTGAGDAFCGGFLAARILGLNPLEAAVFGNLAASRVIRQFGGHKSAPTLDTMARVLKERLEDELAGGILNSIT